MKTLLVLVVVALSAMSVSATLVHKSVKIPSAGQVFGPIEKRNPGILKKVGDEFRWCVTPDDLLVDIITSEMVFSTRKDMFDYADKHLTNKTAIIQMVPSELIGRSIEILTIKPITVQELQLVCHASYPGQFFCHDFSHNGHVNRFAYAIVKKMDNQRVLPVVFFSHKACNEETCYWVTHLSEIVVVNKKLITEN